MDGSVGLGSQDLSISFNRVLIPKIINFITLRILFLIDF